MIFPLKPSFERLIDVNSNYFLFQVDIGTQNFFDEKFQKAESAGTAEIDANGKFS